MELRDAWLMVSRDPCWLQATVGKVMYDGETRGERKREII